MVNVAVAVTNFVSNPVNADSTLISYYVIITQ